MNATPDTLVTLTQLASKIRHGKTGEPPKSGGFASAASLPSPLGSAAEVRQRLTMWMAEGEISGWILTVDALAMFDAGVGTLPSDTPLHAELHRVGDGNDDQSLNLRHTPQGWIWEELRFVPETAGGDSFVEEKTVMIDPRHANGAENRLARYQIEWRLDSAPPSNTPATFRPARSRFIGWA